MEFDGFAKLYDLLRWYHLKIMLYNFAHCDDIEMVSQLLGLLGHVVTKIHLLTVTRRFCERFVDSRPEGMPTIVTSSTFLCSSCAEFIRASLDLGHEYTKLGKTERAANIYASVRTHMNHSVVSDELRVLYFLRYAELLGTLGNVLKG